MSGLLNIENFQRHHVTGNDKKAIQHNLEELLLRDDLKDWAVDKARGSGGESLKIYLNNIRKSAEKVIITNAALSSDRQASHVLPEQVIVNLMR